MINHNKLLWILVQSTNTHPSLHLFSMNISVSFYKQTKDKHIDLFDNKFYLIVKKYNNYLTPYLSSLAIEYLTNDDFYVSLILYKQKKGQ